MKKINVLTTVKRLSNLFYNHEFCDVNQMTEEYALIVITDQLGVFTKDTKLLGDFIFFTDQLMPFIDAMFLIDSDAKGQQLHFSLRKKMLGDTHLTRDQIIHPMKFINCFFQMFAIKSIRLTLHLWLEAMIIHLNNEKIELEENEIFPFFLALHEQIEVAHLLNKYLKSL